MLKNKKIIVIIILNLFLISLSVLPASAQQIISEDLNTSIEDQLYIFSGIAGYGYSAKELPPEVIIAGIIQTLLGFLGVIFIILIIYAGYLWMTAGGNEETIKKARDIIKRSLMGLLIIVASYALTFAVIYILQTALRREY